MKTLWTRPALDDLDNAVAWISDYDIDAAMRLDNGVELLVKRLEQFPFSGRIGRTEGTREAIIGNYVLIYAVRNKHIEILRFLHGAQKYPPD